MRRHRSHVALGFITLVAGLLISPSLVAWMSPTIAGLILAIPLSWASGQRSIGLFLKRIGLLRTPEETSPPAIALRANVLAGELAQAGYDVTDGISALHASRELRVLHEAYLPAPAPRTRGALDHDAVMARAKLAEAETVEEAESWLNRRERTAVLNDRDLIDRVARLPSADMRATAAQRVTPPRRSRFSRLASSRRRVTAEADPIVGAGRPVVTKLWPRLDSRPRLRCARAGALCRGLGALDRPPRPPHV